MKSLKLQALVFFVFAYSAGFLTHWGLYKFKSQNFSMISDIEQSDRQPVAPEDLRPEDLMGMLHQDMLERMHSGQLDSGQNRENEKEENYNEDSYGLKNFLVQDINRREDKSFVYYEVPLINERGEKIELNVEVSDGVIEIKQKSIGENHQSESTRVFTIEPGLQNSKAQVINESDKVVIKIPKA